MMRRALALACLTLAAPVAAQEDDRSFLTAFLEDNLSSAGRNVTITGFAGALSSQASIQSMTIADSEGVWITLNGLVLDWSRSSLLSGRLVLTELSAEEIIVARPPITEDSELPSAEAQGFSLPELPVSVEIGLVAADRIVLDPAVLGQPVEGSLEASLSLIAGEGVADFNLSRTDSGPDAVISLEASYSNANEQLSIALVAREGEGGVAATLLNLPGTPASELTVTGSGPFNDFTADVRLATDDVERLAGEVTLTSDPTGDYQFGADLSGDLAPLFLPDYAEFFGPEVSLVVDGTRFSTGRLSLSEFAVTTRALQLQGSAELAADGLPEQLSLTGTLADPSGAPVLLPFAGERTEVASATLDIGLTQGSESGWRGAFVLQGLDRADFSAAEVTIDGSGRIGRNPAGNSLGATIRYAASGIAPSDPALAEALGPTVSGTLRAHWLEGSGKLSLPEVTIEGTGYSALARLAIEGLEEALTMTGSVEVTTPSFARFSALAGRPLGGSGRAVVEGSTSPLSGLFDVIASFEGQGLSVGIPQLDALLSAESTVTASIRRDETGTTLRAFDLAARTLTATASGRLSSEGSDLSGSVAFTDLAALGPGYRGALALDAEFTGTATDGDLTITGTGRNLGLGQPDLDRILAGQSTLRADLDLTNGTLQISAAEFANPQLSLTANGQVTGGTRNIALDARLANLALLVPQFPGPLTISGTARQDEAGYRLDLRGRGPGQVDASVTGRISPAFDTASLTMSGTAQAALANVFLGARAISGPVRFDLGLNGPLRLSSLNGRVALSGGRLSDPRLGFAFERIEAVADLAGGRAQLSATTQLTTGGRIRIDGPISLTAPFNATLSLSLERLRLVDPELFETFASGNVRIDGPLTGGSGVISGRIDLAETEVRIPSTGFGSAAGLPNLQHANEPADVRNTRVKAGLLGDANGNTRRAAGGFRLDLQISAPNQVFIRGRGIDAELGGTVRLGGTTSAIVPFGGLSLIRGRLDILGSRLILTEADLRLEGGLIPEILVAASTESDGITSTVRIEGPANAPEVTFTSAPELPQEEVLARLLFGRDLQSLSALQAAQLANAVAVLAGRGGEGIIGRLREGFGLDDLDFATAEDGSVAVRAGKYIAENVYSEIEVGQDGQSRLNLNLDLRPGVTVKGRVGADGDTGIGIFIERDY